jgi:hypothetical protein
VAAVAALDGDQARVRLDVGIRQRQERIEVAPVEGVEGPFVELDVGARPR